MKFTLYGITWIILTIYIDYFFLYIFLDCRCAFLLWSKSMSCGPGCLLARRLVKDSGRKWYETGTASGGGSRKRIGTSATASLGPTERR